MHNYMKGKGFESDASRQVATLESVSLLYCLCGMHFTSIASTMGVVSQLSSR